MDEMLVVGILQGISNLLDIGDDRREGQDRSFRVALAQCAAHSIVQNQKGDTIHDVEVEDPHNMGVFEMSNDAGFFLEALYLFIVGESRVEDFDGGMSS